ncbi:alpha/beta fold hydrolase [Nocardiopsis potens]|uniref:alpha/beta fold hydrolase n=1 Tax=Nocardiopsis potens TaxID=1246458 RepID=UPI00034CE434|nr:alpha/beta fold hydrolase [Nocardiopsis potens]
MKTVTENLPDIGAVLNERFPSSHGEVAWGRLGSGSPVVLLHGTPFSSLVWREAAEALSARHTVYLWDMPGYGLSEKRGGQDVSLPAQQRVFTELLDHWGLEAPAVAAHDIGGAVALRAALLGGVRYRRLALADAVALQPWGSPFYRLGQEHSAVLGALPPQMHEAVVGAYVDGGTHQGLRAGLREALVRPWTGAEGRAAFYRQIAQADQRHTAEFEDRLGELSMPVAVVWGAEDEWIPAERGEALAARIPGAEFHLLSGAGHLVQEDAPGRLAALLSAFLAD